MHAFFAFFLFPSWCIRRGQIDPSDWDHAQLHCLAIAFFPLSILMKLWRGQPDNWKPRFFGAKEQGRAWIGLGAFFFMLAVSSYKFPSPSPPTGKWAWLHKLSYGAFGIYGDTVLYTSMGAFLLVFGLIKLFENKS